MAQAVGSGSSQCPPPGSGSCSADSLLNQVHLHDLPLPPTTWPPHCGGCPSDSSPPTPCQTTGYDPSNPNHTFCAGWYGRQVRYGWYGIHACSACSLPQSRSPLHQRVGHFTPPPPTLRQRVGHSAPPPPTLHQRVGHSAPPPPTSHQRVGHSAPPPPTSHQRVGRSSPPLSPCSNRKEEDTVTEEYWCACDVLGGNGDYCAQW